MKSNQKQEEKGGWRKFLFFFIMIITFYAIAISLWLISGNIFYLANFIIIGTALGLGLGLWPVFSKKNRHKARKLSQALVGGYMFFGLGFGFIYIFYGVIEPENMQFEGFWFWLIAGMFAAAVLHYLIAKILGPFVFNRGFCGWACWTAALLDYLPWKKSPGRIKRLGILRYTHFFISATLIFILVFIYGYNLQSTSGIVILYHSIGTTTRQYNFFWQIPELWWFLAGNLFYFCSGVLLAAFLKDNRAFCKYLCPISCFLKIGSKFSLMKIQGNSDKCVSCFSCDRACPMDIKISEYVQNNSRVTSSECIFCLSCVNSCPEKILGVSLKLDKKFNEFLQYKK